MVSSSQMEVAFPVPESAAVVSARIMVLL